MSGDPSIAPSAARERMAFRAGLRPRAAWLAVGGFALATAVVLGGRDPADLARGAGLGELSSAPEAALEAAARRLTTGTAALAGIVLFVLAIVGVASGGLGPVSGTERRRLVMHPIGPNGLRVATAIGGSVGLVILVAATLRGTIAGAARGPAASEAGLFLLWSGTAMRVLGVMAGLLVVAGVIELVVSRHAIRRALFQTEAEARAEARRGGGPRG